MTISSADRSTELPIELLLVDDHTILRQGMRQLLEIEPGIRVLDEAGDGEEAILKALTRKPDIILLDVNLPKVNGYEVSRAVLAAWPAAKIIVLTNQDDPAIIKKFLDLGVYGFLMKDIPVESLVQGIVQVMRGEKIPLPADLAAKVAGLKSANSTGGSAFALTEREKEVLTALCKGYSNQQLADLLMVSPKTVHNHLYNIYSKIGVKNRAEAIVWAMDTGLR